MLPFLFSLQPSQNACLRAMLSEAVIYSDLWREWEDSAPRPSPVMYTPQTTPHEGPSLSTTPTPRTYICTDMETSTTICLSFTVALIFHLGYVEQLGERRGVFVHVAQLTKILVFCESNDVLQLT